jgi:hypothetical protein
MSEAIVDLVGTVQTADKQASWSRYVRLDAMSGYFNKPRIAVEWIPFSEMPRVFSFENSSSDTIASKPSIMHQALLPYSWIEGPGQADEEVAKLSTLEDQLLTKKLKGNLSRLEEMKLASVQDQIDRLLQIEQSDDAEEELLSRFDLLLEQGRGLLEKLDKLTGGNS